jgi:hypothetical protein
MILAIQIRSLQRKEHQFLKYNQHQTHETYTFFSNFYLFIK